MRMRTRAGAIAVLVGFGLLIAFLLTGAGPTWAGPGAGGPFLVNSVLDGSDTAPGDGQCETATAGECTLRAAIQEANAEPGVDTILFAVTGTITLSAELPNISQSLNLLGPGADALSLASAYVPTTFMLPLIGAASSNVYLISGLELRGNFEAAGIGVNNGALTLDQMRLFQTSRGLLVFGAGTQATVRASSFISNHALLGGAIQVQAASLLLVDSRLDDNGATDGGGALDNDGLTVIRASTFSNNSAGTAGLGGVGGAINNEPGGRLSVINSTLSGNATASNVTSSGGGLYNAGVLTLTNATFSGNSTPGLGGGLRLVAGSVTLLRNSIIANSPDGGDCSNTGGVNAGGTVLDGGYNLIEDNTCGFTGGADPLLGPLADNGGQTATQALLAGSPAIDAGNPAGCANPFGLQLVFDQRGYQRAVDGDANPGAHCDIGAFEYLSTVLNLPMRYFLPFLGGS